MIRACLLVFAAGVAAAIALMAPATSSYAAETVTVRAGDYWFCDPSFHVQVCTTTVRAGDTVVWDFNGSNEPHTTTECGADCDRPSGSPLWDSGMIDVGGPPFARIFDAPGSYLYYCRVHPIDMRGRIVVEAAAPVPSPTGQPAPDGGDDAATPPATPGPPLNALPPAGSGLQGSIALGWTAMVLGSGGLVLLGTGVWSRMRRSS